MNQLANGKRGGMRQARVAPLRAKGAWDPNLTVPTWVGAPGARSSGAAPRVPLVFVGFGAFPYMSTYGALGSGMTGRRLIVFTDLDGTLLDHDDYSYEPARPALAALAAHAVPLIFATSKTRAELVTLRAEIGNTHPFIVENGGAVYVPPGYFSYRGAPAEETLLGASYDKVRRAVVRLRQEHGLVDDVIGFGDLDAPGVAALTGLSLQDAERARVRTTSEPLWLKRDSPALEPFLRALVAEGFSTKRGGRFLHVQGPVDKASGVRFLLECFRTQWPSVEWISAALGDSGNDLGMLRQVNVPIALPSGDPDRPPLVVGREDAILPSEPGPRGFKQGIDALLSRYAV